MFIHFLSMPKHDDPNISMSAVCAVCLHCTTICTLQLRVFCVRASFVVSAEFLGMSFADCFPIWAFQGCWGHGHGLEMNGGVESYNCS